MLGAITGDTVGSAYEFHNTKDYDFRLFLPESNYTDDTVMTMAVAHTLGMEVTFLSALLLCVVATFGACGASGVAGGSLLLIPMACSFFGISNDVAMQAVAIGFVIGVVQDSVETALNSSGDAFFTATAEYYDEKRRSRKSRPSA